MLVRQVSILLKTRAKTAPAMAIQSVIFCLFQPIPAIWSYLFLSRLFGAIQGYSELYNAIWSHLEPFGVIWSHLVPFGTILSYLQPFGSFFETLKVIWSYL